MSTQKNDCSFCSRTQVTGRMIVNVRPTTRYSIEPAKIFQCQSCRLKPTKKTPRQTTCVACGPCTSKTKQDTLRSVPLNVLKDGKLWIDGPFSGTFESTLQHTTIMPAVRDTNVLPDGYTTRQYQICGACCIKNDRIRHAKNKSDPNFFPKLHFVKPNTLDQQLLFGEKFFQIIVFFLSPLIYVVNKVVSCVRRCCPSTVVIKKRVRKKCTYFCFASSSLSPVAFSLLSLLSLLSLFSLFSRSSLSSLISSLSLSSRLFLFSLSLSLLSSLVSLLLSLVSCLSSLVSLLSLLSYLIVIKKRLVIIKMTIKYTFH